MVYILLAIISFILLLSLYVYNLNKSVGWLRADLEALHNIQSGKYQDIRDDQDDDIITYEDEMILKTSNKKNK